MTKPLNKMTVRPGINTQATQTLNEGGWSTCNLIRFQDGLLQKLGGWERLDDAALAGYSRGLHAFQDLSGNDYLLSGSLEAMQVYFNGTLYTLVLYGEVHQVEVPWLQTTNSLGVTYYFVTDPENGQSASNLVSFDLPAEIGNLALYPASYTIDVIIDPDTYSINYHAVNINDTGGEPPLYNVTETSTLVHVTLTNHGLSPGDTFTVDLGVSVGGVSLFGDYIVQVEPITTDAFVILSGSTASYTDQVYGLQNSDGDALSQLSYHTDIPADAGSWSIDNFGEVALFTYNGGPLFYWRGSPVDNLIARGVFGAPLEMTGMFVAMPQAQVICYGAEVNGIRDELLIRWSDAGDYTNFTASATNQAGSFRLSRGSHIVGGGQFGQMALLWTDIEVWSMQYIGPPFIYAFAVLAAGCGLIAQRARAVCNNEVYWMSQRQFFKAAIGGGVVPLPCTVWDEVFNDLDADNIDKIFAGPNAAFTEVVFWYPSASGGTGEIDSYVKLNVVTGLWDYGSSDQYARTSWMDQSVFGTPIGIDLDKRIQQHEIGYDADTEAMDGVYAETGYIDLGDGTDIIMIDQIIPDFKWFGENGSIQVTVRTINYPSDTPVSHGPYTVTATTQFIGLRARARQAAFRIEWTATTGYSARLGAMRFRNGAAGQRP